MKLSSWQPQGTFQETKAITSKTHDMLATMISLLIVNASLRRSPCMQAYKFFKLIAKDMKKSDFRTLNRKLTASVKAIPIYTLEPVSGLVELQASIAVSESYSFCFRFYCCCYLVKLRDKLIVKSYTPLHISMMSKQSSLSTQ